ncbi:MAG: hypothetical protein KBA24_00925 [Dysgonomonadaceae bacterium]|jgi:hypothetical protein|nr:hypothetical protein [Dysgonamonadaceae bacterium]
MIRRKSKYEIQQSNKVKELIKKSNIFNGDLGGKLFPTDNGFIPKADYLMNSRNNLHNFMVQDVIDYFSNNEIVFWKTGITGVDEYKMPTGHTLSSQISCLNHLFPFRNDKKAVEDLFSISNPVKIDDGYITFEFTNKNISYLSESCETRGSKCTSIDAFVKSNKIGIGIEWKYTETDFDTTKAKDYWKQHYIERYKPLLENSNIIENDVLISCQMYYELMRQTLLLEQMTFHNEIADYKNIVVCPVNNKELFECCIGWKANLKDDKKFEVIDPNDLFANIDKVKYQPLIDYLSIRYWND